MTCGIGHPLRVGLETPVCAFYDAIAEQLLVLKERQGKSAGFRGAFSDKNVIVAPTVVAMKLSLICP